MRAEALLSAERWRYYGRDVWKTLLAENYDVSSTSALSVLLLILLIPVVLPLVVTHSRTFSVAAIANVMSERTDRNSP